MNTLLTEEFLTKLGTIQVRVESSNTENFTSNGKFTKTTGHKINLQSFEVRNEWLPENMNIEASRGWRWFIEKTSETPENLFIYCQLINPYPNILCGSNSGQHLDSIEIENEIDQLHIGTEDGEIMQYRAEVTNWMPNRFKDTLSISYSFTEYIDFGFLTSVPNLNFGERIYFHFIVATNSKKPSKEFPNEQDVSTWYAVDQHKNFLDKVLQDPYGG